MDQVSGSRSKRVIDIAESWKHAETCIATERDMEFLQTDGDLLQVVTLLRAYGDEARYYHMNVIVSEPNKTEDPEQAFDLYCTELFMRQEGWEEHVTGGNLGEKIEANIESINRQITILLQKFARALCRMFTLGKLGELAKAQTGTIACFLYLTDEDLGNVKIRWFAR